MEYTNRMLVEMKSPFLSAMGLYSQFALPIPTTAPGTCAPLQPHQQVTSHIKQENLSSVYRPFQEPYHTSWSPAPQMTNPSDRAEPAAVESAFITQAVEKSYFNQFPAPSGDVILPSASPTVPDNIQKSDQNFEAKKYLNNGVDVMKEPGEQHRCQHGQSFQTCVECKSLAMAMVTRPYVCPECNKMFTQLHSLQTHMQGHGVERPYNCHVCSKGFTQLSALQVL